MIARLLLALRLLFPARPQGARRQCLQGLMFAVDIARFGGRPAHLQAKLRSDLYDIIEEACQAVGLALRRCTHEDRGDGLFVIIAAGADVATVVNALTATISAALRAHNQAATGAARFQLRMAIHGGHFQPDPHGITSPDLNHLFRLLDSPALKTALTTHHDDLALIVSDHIYTTAISYNLINPADYQPTTINIKETNTQAWIRNPPPPQQPAPTPTPQFALLIPVTLVHTTTEPANNDQPTITCHPITELPPRPNPTNPSEPKPQPPKPA